MRATASFAMAVLSMAAIQAAQAADSIVQAHAQLIELSYQLEDLTPGDNLGALYGGNGYRADRLAEVSYREQALNSAGTKIVDRELEYTRMSNPYGGRLNAELISGEASATAYLGDTSTEQVQVNLGKDRFEEGFTYGELNGERFGGPSVNASVATSQQNRWLGAGTGVTFSATFTLGVSVDASGLDGLTQGENLRAKGVAEFFMSLKPYYSVPGLEFEEGLLKQVISVQQDVGPGGLLSGAGMARQTFTLTGRVLNSTDRDVWITESWGVNALARVSPVPEPTSWALWLAGLALVQLMRQRQTV